MRLGVFAVILSVLIAGGACSGSSAEGIFSNGGAGGSGGSNGGDGGSASGTGGVLGTGGDGGSAGSFGTGGNFGSGGSGAGGTTFDADIDTGFGGTTDSGPEPDGGGSGGTGGGAGDGLACGGNRCDRGRLCCFSSNAMPYCAPPGAECACTGLCTTTTMSCDSQSDCENGEICCATVAYSVGSARVSTVRCQPSCSTTLVEYVVCDTSGPDTCPGQTNCSQALLLSAIDVCQ